MTLSEFEKSYRARQKAQPRVKEGCSRTCFGPDWPGCINSGTRPALMHVYSRFGGHLFFVGPEMDVRDKWIQLSNSVRSTGKGLRKVTRYKTRASAEKAWLARVGHMLDVYAERDADYAKARALQAQGRVVETQALIDKWR